MTGTSYLNTTNSLSIVRGTTKTISLTITDEAGDAFDLTDATIWFSVKKTLADVNPLILKKSDTPTDITITSAREGTAEIYLIPSDTFDMDVREYLFDVWVVTATGARYLVTGPSTLEIQNSVTRIQ